MFHLEIFTNYIIEYFLNYGRRFAWRIDRAPCKIYLSEILLQRTRAEQAETVFIKLAQRFRDVNELVKGFTEVQEIMKPLGRFCRLEPFKKGLIYLAENYKGEIPFNRDDLLLIPSVGPYISAAIRIFGFNIRDVIIDTNVVKVLGRFYGLKVTPETRRRKFFLNLAEKHVPQERFVEYSYGILDLAAQICHVNKPECNLCGLALYCEFNRSRMINP